MSIYLYINCIISYFFNVLFYIFLKFLKYFTSDHKALRICTRIFIYVPQYYFSIPIQTLFRSLLNTKKINSLEQFNNKEKVPFYTITNEDHLSKDIVSILYIHGDDYTSRRNFCTELYDRIQNKCPNRKIEIHIPLYRSFPEYSIECSLNDIAIIYKYLKEKSRNLWIIADSIGGSLAIQLATEMSELDCTGIILLSPITNFYCDYPSFEYIKDDCLYPIEAKKMIQSKINPQSLHNVNIIPISIPIYIFVSQNELYRDDARDIYRINRHARLYEISNTVHLFPLFWHVHEKGNQALNKIVSIINLTN
jgi:acetyl esterase/lipase